MVIELRLEQIHVQKATVNGHKHEVLQDISLTCNVGERIGLIGRNGSGKTTLARILSGLDRPSQGKRHITPNSVGVGLVLQRPEDHFTRETVQKQVASFASGKLKSAVVEELLIKVGLSPNISNQPPLNLSDGEQRLVVIACALARKTSFIVLDEPLAGLDSNGRQQVSRTLAKLTNEQELGLIIISHHLDDLLGLVDRLWMLNHGKLVYDGPFAKTPLSSLKPILSPQETSLYYILRQLESRGVQLPEAVYNGLTPEQIVRILSGAIAS